MKKVLILTVTAGNGHNSAANAMKNKLVQAGCEVLVVDIIKEYTSLLNSWTVDKGYNIAVGYLRPLYDAFYKSYLKYNPKKRATCPAQASVRSLNGKLLKLIYDFQPDVIYGTSYYCGMALSNLRRVYNIPAKVVVCMLDYVVSPFWEASIEGVDYLTISHEDFRVELLEKGFDNSQLIYTGIPVSEKFVEIIEKREARKRLGIDENLFTVFVFYGGGHWHGGYKVLKTIIKNFKDPLQIVVVNGNDKKTKLKIDKEMAGYPKNFKVVNYGFSKEVDLIMSACDVMFGKGGGLSTTESVNKCLPLIATKKLPGQELYNVVYLENKNVAKTFKNSKQLLEHLACVYQDPKILETMRNNLAEMKTNGIETIFQLILSQPYADYALINKKLDFQRVNKIVDKSRKITTKRLLKEKK